MKKFLLASAITCLFPLLGLAQEAKYVYSTDLQNIQNDLVKVTLTPPTIAERKATFQIPSIVPGTYAKKDYGRFVTQLQAFDAKGKNLKVKRQGNNTFSIKRANKLKRVEYLVNDSWDDSNTKDFVFQPSGTNTEAGKNVVINHHAYYGYFEGYKNLPFEMNYTKPNGWFGATSLPQKSSNNTKDVFTAPNYTFLVDNPIMYSLPDTISFQVNNMRVHVAVYSPNKMITAAQIMPDLEPTARALDNFFGTLPVNQYNFLFYFADQSVPLPDVESGLSGYGALEHSYCSMYYLPEAPYSGYLKQLIRDVTSHEFLHILTPLTIHSKQIEDFNFVTPDMSQHLWMYEGLTEYFAHLIQLRSKLVTEDDFWKEMRNKIDETSRFDNFSFTEMSKRVVEKDFEKYYTSVYQEGALFGLCLDLLLLKESNGKSGLRELMLQLSQKYGANRPFEDDKLFDEIVSMTYPSVRNFFDRYIIGKENLPYNNFLDIVGYEYLPSQRQTTFSFGQLGIAFDEEKKGLYFSSIPKNCPLKLQEGDLIRGINGTEINFDNPLGVQDLLINNLYNKKDDSSVTVTIERNGEKIDLSGQPQKTDIMRKHIVQPIQKPSEAQQKMNRIFVGQ